MKNYERYFLIALLILSGLLLSSLVPGGPIENRDFSHIHPAILLVFNIYLTILGLGVFILVPYVWKQKAAAFKLTYIAGLSLLVIYLIDLAGWFPKSPTAMSPPLYWIEVAGLVVSLPMMWLSYRSIDDNASNQLEKYSVKGLPAVKTITFTLVGILIIAFATISAVQSGS